MLKDVRAKFELLCLEINNFLYKLLFCISPRLNRRHNNYSLGSNRFSLCTMLVFFLAIIVTYFSPKVFVIGHIIIKRLVACYLLNSAVYNK